jgi:hypothetical protein
MNGDCPPASPACEALIIDVVAPELLTIDRLERWALFGAQWRVVELAPDHAVVDMCACTGELVERAESDDTAVIAYLRAARDDGE